MRMSKIWRWVAPLAMAGGLVAALGVVPAEAASTAAYTVTIQAKNPHVPNVTGDTFVIFGQKTIQNATISGTVTGATSGDVVTLLAEPFKATHFTAVGAKTLTTPTETYSFSVRPTLATRYAAQVTTGSAIDATSKTEPVYVTLLPEVPKNGTRTKCNRTGCTETITTRTIVPASAYRTESAKHWYLYLGVNRSRGNPSIRPPKYLLLTKTATASKARKINAQDFQVILTFRIAFDGKNIRWFPNACTKDDEPKDGIGLPGHHDCGNSKVASNSAYLG
jgi:hypothetical protein